MRSSFNTYHLGLPARKFESSVIANEFMTHMFRIGVSCRAKIVSHKNRPPITVVMLLGEPVDAS